MCVSAHTNADMNTAWVCSQGSTQPPEKVVPADAGQETDSPGHR